MLNYISSKAPVLLLTFCFIGFLLPDISMQVFKLLPFVLFFLMFFTLVGLDQAKLVKSLFCLKGWMYALVHTFLMIGICAVGIIALDLNDDYALAVLGVASTGSLFATPAIARSIGLNYFSAMTYTITSTLLKPVALYVVLYFTYSTEFDLDMRTYLTKLVVYIIGPMAISFVIHSIFSLNKILMVHSEVAKFNIILVFLFPLGLMGDFRGLWESDSSYAMNILLVAFTLCIAFFIIAFTAFYFTNRGEAIIAAITSGNRNVLLTYTIADAYLGPLFLPLVGALQLPIYLQPIVIRYLGTKRYGKKNLSY